MNIQALPKGTFLIEQLTRINSTFSGIGHTVTACLKVHQLAVLGGFIGIASGFCLVYAYQKGYLQRGELVQIASSSLAIPLGIARIPKIPAQIELPPYTRTRQDCSAPRQIEFPNQISRVRKAGIGDTKMRGRPPELLRLYELPKEWHWSSTSLQLHRTRKKTVQFVEPPFESQPYTRRRQERSAKKQEEFRKQITTIRNAGIGYIKMRGRQRLLNPCRLPKQWNWLTDPNDSELLLHRQFLSDFSAQVAQERALQHAAAIRARLADDSAIEFYGPD